MTNLTGMVRKHMIKFDSKQGVGYVLDGDWDESAHPRAENGQFGPGIEKDKYGNTKTKETLSRISFYSGKKDDVPLHLNPDHDERTVIISHGGESIGSAEHVGGKWQATSWSHDVKPEHLDILNRAAPRGLRDIDPSEYTASGERKGQKSLF